MGKFPNIAIEPDRWFARKELGVYIQLADRPDDLQQVHNADLHEKLEISVKRIQILGSYK